MQKYVVLKHSIGVYYRAPWKWSRVLRDVQLATFAELILKFCSYSTAPFREETIHRVNWAISRKRIKLNDPLLNANKSDLQ